MRKANWTDFLARRTWNGSWECISSMGDFHDIGSGSNFKWRQLKVLINFQQNFLSCNSILFCSTSQSRLRLFEPTKSQPVQVFRPEHFSRLLQSGLSPILISRELFAFCINQGAAAHILAVQDLDLESLLGFVASSASSVEIAGTFDDLEPAKIKTPTFLTDFSRIISSCKRVTHTNRQKVLDFTSKSRLKT